jgi:four helix bundle protein
MRSRRWIPPKAPPGLRGLRVYEEAVMLAEVVHHATRHFWRCGSGRLAAQMRDASESVFSNIAEGHGRRTVPDRRRFYETAWTSLLELEARTQHAMNCDLLSGAYAVEIRQRAQWVGRLLSPLRRSTGGR